MNSIITVHDDGEVDLIAFLQVVWAGKFIVLAVTVFFGCVAVYLALAATPIYTASAVVNRVSESNVGAAASLASQLGGLGNFVGMNLGGRAPNRESQAVLKSRRLAEEFIVRGKLMAELSPENDDTFTLWRAVKQFREQILTVRENSEEGMTIVSIDWTDAAVAAQWANGYVALANDIIRTQALDESERNIEFLNKQIEQTNAVGLQRVMYNLIEAETKTLMLANARADFAFSNIDPAVAPEVRSKPKRKIIVLSGGVLGFFFGIFSIFTVNIVRQVRAKEKSESS